MALLPANFQAAFEFRRSSWFDEEVYAALEEKGAALVVADTGNEKLPPVVTRGSPYGYARLRREEYEDGELEEWLERLSAPDWDDLYVFFKHEDAGAGPRLARRFAGLAAAR